MKAIALFVTVAALAGFYSMFTAANAAAEKAVAGRNAAILAVVEAGR